MIKTVLNFEKNEVQKAERYFGSIHINNEQKGFIESYSKFFSQHIPLNERAIKGFLLLSVRDMQQKHSIDLLDIAKFPPEKRAKAGLEFAEIFKNKLTRILIDKSQEPLLNDAMKQALSMYQQQINK